MYRIERDRARFREIVRGKLRGDLNFSPEATAVNLGGQLGRQELDDDPPAEEPVASDKDPAHPSATELPLDVVRVGEEVLYSLFECRHLAGSTVVEEDT